LPFGLLVQLLVGGRDRAFGDYRRTERRIFPPLLLLTPTLLFLASLIFLAPAPVIVLLLLGLLVPLLLFLAVVRRERFVLALVRRERFVLAAFGVVGQVVVPMVIAIVAIDVDPVDVLLHIRFELVQQLLGQLLLLLQLLDSIGQLGERPVGELVPCRRLHLLPSRLGPRVVPSGVTQLGVQHAPLFCRRQALLVPRGAVPLKGDIERPDHPMQEDLEQFFFDSHQATSLA
jgi:hypothetical protein